MKLFTKLTLQWRITLLAAIVLTICSVALTVFSMLNAQRNLVPFITDPSILNADAIAIQIAEGAQSGFATKAKQSFNVTSVIFCLVLTVIGTGFVYFVSGKALRPVRNLNKQVSDINEHDLSRRLTESLSNDEVSSLTKSFNLMLDRLEEAFKRQKRFSASAAHELKTPLATMKAGIQVLRIDKNTTLDEYKENAHIVETSVDRLTQVVDDLLLLASAGEDVEELKEEVYLDAMFETIFDELIPLYDNRGITYEINCNSVIFCGNAALLYRVFFNLIENAYKYNRENGHISVSVDKTNKDIKIVIEDNGCGIPSEHLPFVFEAFYRVDASRSRKIAGSGLGLSIVKSIIERHGGTISVSSEDEKGTKFSILLPE